MVVGQDQSPGAEIEDPADQGPEGDLDIGPQTGRQTFGRNEMPGLVEEDAEQALVLCVAEGSLEVCEELRARRVDDLALERVQRAVVGELARRGDRLGQLTVRGEGLAQRFAGRRKSPRGRAIGRDQPARDGQGVGSGEGTKPRRQLGYGPQVLARRM